MTPAQLENALFDGYKIHTVGIVWENIRCVRVTPHVYTSIADLDTYMRTETCASAADVSYTPGDPNIKVA